MGEVRNAKGSASGSRQTNDGWWRRARPAVAFTLLSALGILAATVILRALLCEFVPDTKLSAFTAAVSTDTVAQIVPAIVVAIFVFAVGTAFVVAQVVPPARGTRAVAVLRGKRLYGTIAPAPILLLGSAVLTTKLWWTVELAMVLLIASVFYTLGSLIAMMGILIDATDPRVFRRRLSKKAKQAS